MVLVGLDPGGAEAFGWCILEDADAPPLRVRAAGVADHASEALANLDVARAHDDIIAAGIDAPLFWAPSGDRNVDAHVRTAICSLGASSGTVNHVSSLRGACLVQGIVAAMLLRRRAQTMPLTEAHPKASLWLLGEATLAKKPVSVTMQALERYIHVGTLAMPSDHERDAALSALAAWAMVHRASGWKDIRGLDPSAVSPLSDPLGYWIPADAKVRPQPSCEDLP